MTREEKSKAIDALKISAPIMAVTQEKFKDYIQTLNQIMDWIEQESRWISVKERLPEDGKYVLACDMYKEMMIGTIYEDNCGDSNTNYDAEDENGCVMYDVVAWMPLPEPYKSESEK